MSTTKKTKKTVTPVKVLATEEKPFEPIQKVGKFVAIVWDGGTQQVYTKDGETLFAYTDKKGKARIGVKTKLTNLFED